MGPDGALGSIHARSQKLQSVEQKETARRHCRFYQRICSRAPSKGEKQQAANQYLRFVNEFPKNDKAAPALFAAAEITEQLEQTEPAVQLYQRLIKSYGKTKQATGAHWQLGFLYQRQTQFEKAAQMFEKMASFPDVPQVKDALFNAAQTRKALGQYVKTISIMNTYVKKYPKDPGANSFVLQIAELFERQKRWEKAISTYRRFIKSYGSAHPERLPVVYLNLAKAYQNLGKRDARKNASRELSKVGSSVTSLFKPVEAKAQGNYYGRCRQVRSPVERVPGEGEGDSRQTEEAPCQEGQESQDQSGHETILG